MLLNHKLLWGEAMQKNPYLSFFKNLLKAILCLLCTIMLVLFPKEAGNGIKEGFTVLYETLIPTLFPFMILSSYIASAPFTAKLRKKLNKLSYILFNLNGCAFITLLLNFLGGYPIGGKTACEFYENKQVTQMQAKRLLFFCVNPSFPFCVTALGTFMLRNTKAGVLLFLSSVLSSLTVGFILSFTEKRCYFKEEQTHALSSEFLFIDSVSKGNYALISVCGWVLIFSALCSVLKALPLNNNASVFLSCIFEVTTGCKAAVENSLPLPFISLMLSFGGLAVIFQVGPYLKKCNVSIKEFFCWRVINGALSGLYCLGFTKLFPTEITTSANLNVGDTVFTFNHSFLAGGICILMCLVFIFEVDNRRKIC